MDDSITKVYKDFTRYLLEANPNFPIYMILPSLQLRGVLHIDDRLIIENKQTPEAMAIALFLEIMPMKDERFHDDLVNVFKGLKMPNIEQFLAQRLATYRQAQLERLMAATTAATNSASYHIGNQGDPSLKTLVSKGKRSNVYKLLRKKLGTTYHIHGILGELYDVDVITFEEKDAIKKEDGNIDKLIKIFDQFMPPKDEACHRALITYLTINKQSEFAKFLEENLFE